MQLATIQRLQRRPRIDHAATGKIDQDTAVFHQIQAVGVDQAFGAIDERHMNRYRIRGFEQPIQGLDLFHSG